MKLIKANLIDYKPHNNDAAKAINEFLDMHVPCAEVTEYNYHSPDVCRPRIYMILRDMNMSHIKTSVRKGKVFLINTLIKEK